MIIFCYKALNIKLGESMLIRLFAFLFFSLTLTNCISVSSLQTARTLKEKEWSVQTAIGTQSVKFKEYSDNNDKKELQKTIESVYEIATTLSIRKLRQEPLSRSITGRTRGFLGSLVGTSIIQYISRSSPLTFLNVTRKGFW